NPISVLSVAGGTIAGVHGGTAVLQAGNRTVRFTPAADANDGTTPGGFGSSYKASDGSLVSANAATVTVHVAAVNDAPVAVDDSANTNEDTYVDIPVSGNDTDVDNPNSDLSVAAGTIAGVHGGSAVLQAGNRTVRFTPAADANDGNTPGGFGFSYKASDGSLVSANAATVTGAATQPAGQPACALAPPYSGSITAKDSDNATSDAKTLAVTVTRENADVVDITPYATFVDGSDGDVDSLSVGMTIDEAQDG